MPNLRSACTSSIAHAQARSSPQPGSALGPTLRLQAEPKFRLKHGTLEFQGCCLIHQSIHPSTLCNEGKEQANDGKFPGKREFIFAKFACHLGTVPGKRTSRGKRRTRMSSALLVLRCEFHSAGVVIHCACAKPGALPQRELGGEHFCSLRQRAGPCVFCSDNACALTRTRTRPVHVNVLTRYCTSNPIETLELCAS